MPHFCLDDSPHFRMIELDEVSSTNTFLRDYHPVRPTEITLVTAEFQSAGRGQATNRWESERSKNLLFSILVHPQALSLSHLFLLSEAIALSIREAVAQRFADSPVTVKWPNDIYVGDCKIAGILIENAFKGATLDSCIIGCGVNVNQEYFRFPTLAQGQKGIPTPCSLRLLLGCETERTFVLEDVMEGFTRRYAQLQTGHYDDIQREYHAVLYRRDGWHDYVDANGPFRAEIKEVEPSGHLVLHDEMGTFRRYAFKEVRFE